MERSSPPAAQKQTGHNIDDEPQMSLDLATDGDIILVLRGSATESVRIRVSSTLLTHASPVFRAMLSPNRFLEGSTNRSSSNPGSVELPDDDPEGMYLLLKLLHFQSVSFDNDPNTALVAKNESNGKGTRALAALAILAHKYDCVEVVKGTVSLMVAPELERIRDCHTMTASVTDMLVIAYVLRLGPEFTFITRHMVLYETKAFSSIMSSAYKDFLPTLLYRKPPLGMGLVCKLTLTEVLLEEQRTEAQRLAARSLFELENIDCPGCPYNEKFLNSGFMASLTEEVAMGSTLVQYIEETPIAILLTTLWRTDDYMAAGYFRCLGKVPMVEQRQVRGICHETSMCARGLCLPCLLDSKTTAECTHTDRLMESAFRTRVYVYDL